MDRAVGGDSDPVISGPVMGPPVSQLDLPASSLSSSVSRNVLLARCRRHFSSCASRSLDRISRRFNIGPTARQASEFRKQRRINSVRGEEPLSSSPCVLASSNRRWISDALIASCSNTLICKTLMLKTQMQRVSLLLPLLLLYRSVYMRVWNIFLIHKYQAEEIFLSTLRRTVSPTRHNTVRS